MRNPQATSALLAAASLLGQCMATKDSTTTTTAAPCTASSSGGSFYDLRPDIAIAVVDGKKPKHGVRTTDYISKGHDFPANFTVNICAPVLKTPEKAVGIDSALIKNISAYYEGPKGEVCSLGSQSSVLISRGRELVLEYSGGSPCPDPKKSEKRGSPVREGASNKYHDYADEAQEEAYKQSSGKSSSTSGSSSSMSTTKDDIPIRRKSATFAFLCDHDTLNDATVSFVHTPDDCAYFFRVRSQHACAGLEPHKPGSVGPGGVFVIIASVALLVYFVGGVFYQRTVANARGWRQLPNYSLWAGIGSFLWDFVIIATSSCARFLPNRRGYRHLSSSPSRGRNRNREDENRLIDQLDEEWDD